MASSTAAPEQVFIGPGLGRFKLIVTILGLLFAVGIVLWIAVHQAQQGAVSTAIGSTIAAILFIAGFVYHLIYFVIIRLFTIPGIRHVQVFAGINFIQKKVRFFRIEFLSRDVLHVD